MKTKHTKAKSFGKLSIKNNKTYGKFYIFIFDWKLPLSMTAIDIFSVKGMQH